MPVRAMVLPGPGQPLQLTEMPDPIPGPSEVLIDIEACAVCRTDLHLLDGELPDIPYPLIPGHQIVGTIRASQHEALPAGMRVGVPWLGYTCGRCEFCRRGLENLCDAAKFTGYTRPGGYAERVCADARYCFPLPAQLTAVQLAPLLCAGLIGYRALSMCAGAERIGLYGFGAAAHVLAQVLVFQNRPFYAFTRSGDAAAQRAALALGATWAGSSEQAPPTSLDAAIIFAPAGPLVPRALAAVRKGGVVVCGGIHMSPIPEFPYELLWGERQLRSVANLTRQDGVEFLALAARVPIQTDTHPFLLGDANAALSALRAGAFTGSAVLDLKAGAAPRADEACE
jgi:propanol-preferring alcohol dehydrogenase